MAHVDAASIVAAAADLFNTIAAYRTTHATPEPTDNAHLSLISLAARQPPPPIRHEKGVRASCESKLAEGSVQSITKPSTSVGARPRPRGRRQTLPGVGGQPPPRRGRLQASCSAGAPGAMVREPSFVIRVVVLVVVVVASVVQSESASLGASPLVGAAGFAARTGRAAFARGQREVMVSMSLVSPRAAMGGERWMAPPPRFPG